MVRQGEPITTVPAFEWTD